MAAWNFDFSFRSQPSRLVILSFCYFLVITFLLPGKSSKLKLDFWRSNLGMLFSLCPIIIRHNAFHLVKRSNLKEQRVVCYSSMHFYLNSG